MTVLNGFSLTVWKHIAVTFHQAVSNGGRGRTSAKVGLSARFELISSFALASQSSFVSINRNKRPIRNSQAVYAKLLKAHSVKYLASEATGNKLQTIFTSRKMSQ